MKDSKAEVKRLLNESGNGHLFTETNYSIATQLTHLVERKSVFAVQSY